MYRAVFVASLLLALVTLLYAGIYDGQRVKGQLNLCRKKWKNCMIGHRRLRPNAGACNHYLKKYFCHMKFEFENGENGHIIHHFFKRG